MKVFVNNILFKYCSYLIAVIIIVMACFKIRSDENEMIDHALRLVSKELGLKKVLSSKDVIWYGSELKVFQEVSIYILLDHSILDWAKIQKGSASSEYHPDNDYDLKLKRLSQNVLKDTPVEFMRYSFDEKLEDFSYAGFFILYRMSSGNYLIEISI